MTDTFSIDAATSGRTTGLVVYGDLDGHTAAPLREAITATLEAPPDRLVLDLGHVAFIDSMGLGAIVAGAKRADQKGAVLRLINPQPSVRRTLSMFGLEHLVDD